MRFLIKVTLGLVLFNFFLLLTASFFPNATEQNNAIDVTTDPSIPRYNDPSSGIGPAIVNAGVLFGILMTAGLFTGILSGRNVPLYLGVSIVISLLASLYVASIQVFTKISFNNIYISGLITITTIMIGILFILGLGEMLAGRSDTD